MHVATFSEPSTLARKTSKKKGTKRGVEWAHHVFFENALMLFSKKNIKKIIKISPCLSKLQLAKFDAFYGDTV